MHDTKLVGDISEMMVATELLQRGMKVLKPIGDRLPYDLAIDNGDGTMTRIQVRTAYLDKRVNQYFGSVRSVKTNRRRYLIVKPKACDTDFFVFVAQESRTFYVVPSEIVATYASAMRFTPHRELLHVANNGKGCTSQYRDRFDLLTPEVAEKTA